MIMNFFNYNVKNSYVEINPNRGIVKFFLTYVIGPMEKIINISH